MDQFKIHGGRRLEGTVRISGAKKLALPAMAAALLTPEPVGLENIPHVRDIITMAKGINSGYVPLGAMAVREPIADWVRDKYFAGGLTYSGHPLACAVGVASIEAFREEGIVEHAAGLGPVFREKLGAHDHLMMVVPGQPPVDLAQVRQFAGRDNCEYNDEGFSCTVPAGHYFMMGDNRDQSSDSRYWGFGPDANLKGRAFLVWMNFGDLRRIGKTIE